MTSFKSFEAGRKYIVVDAGGMYWVIVKLMGVSISKDLISKKHPHTISMNNFDIQNQF